MTFTPVNNYLYVREIKGSADDLPDCEILLPEEYRTVENPFTVVEVLGSSGDSGTLWGSGLKLVVQAHMLQDIRLHGETFTVITENHVIGILSE